ncbi:MAG TPA: hypothetical protein VL306_02910 [Methylomirabilota bacterium]|jgi:hypothetical protein|nr:hypothetical protein [Methylomirabilota bacterium]
MDSHQKQQPRGFKREEGVPKNGFSEDLPYRIKGLEQAKLEPGMSPQDIAALDRAIAKLQAKLATQTVVKREEKEDQF